MCSMLHFTFNIKDILRSHKVRVWSAPGIIIFTYLPNMGFGHTILLVSFCSEWSPPHKGLGLPLLSKERPILISKFDNLSQQQSERFVMTRLRMKHCRK